jgi:undecaprenyl-diphosphatase
MSLTLLSSFRELDIRILTAVNGNRIGALDGFFVIFTDSAGVVAFGIPLVLLLITLKTKNIVLRRKAWFMLAAVSVSAIVSNILKYSLALPRPYKLYPFIEKLSGGGSPTFPSGHTADAFAFALAFCLCFRNKYLSALVFLWACLIAYSRMALGVHFPSDVLAGALIGLASAWLFHRLIPHRRS